MLFGSGAGLDEARSDSKADVDTNDTSSSRFVEYEKPSIDIEEKEAKAGTWTQAGDTNPRRQAFARARSWLDRARLLCFR